MNEPCEPRIARREFVGSLAAGLLSSTALLSSARAQVASSAMQGEAPAARIVEVTSGLEDPWAMALLPDGRLLATENAGSLRIVAADGRLSEGIKGMPRVHHRGQGGLLDVALSPAYEQDRTIFLSLSEPTNGGARTAVFRAVLDEPALRLRDLTRIFAQNDDPSGGIHFGSRLVFGRDGNLFVTLGDRNVLKARSQSLTSHVGKVVRIMPDGGVPPDNPFVGKQDALPEIWSYGHRNVQGAALHPLTGVLYTHEHGPQGGDELNRDLAGRNYGWPVITHGREYGSGATIGEGTERADIEPALVTWVPSIAPAGLAIHDGTMFPQWRGSMFVGSLKFGRLTRVGFDEAGNPVGQETLLEGVTRRIRDVRIQPDGALLVLDQIGGRILRLTA